MHRYHLWTIGCQMNKAESQRVEGLLRSHGYEAVRSLDAADLIVLNTCVVRQSAEDRVVGTLGLLQGVKRDNPALKIAVTGCFTSLGREDLSRRHPHVDLFFGPGEYARLESWLEGAAAAPSGSEHAEGSCLSRIARDIQPGVSAYVPIMQGCNNFCTYCIVPYTRGREVSRTPDEIRNEAHSLIALGAKEVVLLGQNVDSYGHDLPGHPDLAFLLESLQPVEGLHRIRFLTSHPKDMTTRLISAMSRLDKVCEHLDLALQSGDNDMLRAMGRGYRVEDFAARVAEIREAMPSVSISTDIIVGFPGETAKQFENTYNTLAKLQFDVVHVAAYSPRQGTVAARKYTDDVPADVKSERLHRIESLQEEIAGRINSRLVDTTVEVLVEGRRKGKWFGRTRTDKLVFFQHEEHLAGHMVQIAVDHASPWALQGHVVYNTQVLVRRSDP